MLEVHRVSSVSLADPEAFLAGPTIFTDCVRLKCLLQFWTPKPLAERLGQKQVQYNVSSQGRYGFSPSPSGPRKEYEVHEAPFAALMDGVMKKQQKSFYLMNQSIDQEFAELREILPDVSDILDVPYTRNLWIGNRTKTSLHFDYTNNLFCQLYGEKDFVLVGPAEGVAVGLQSTNAAAPHFSNESLIGRTATRDQKHYPHQAYSARLNAGEAIFIPAFWWHEVAASSMSMSVNHWWAPRPAQVLDAPNSGRSLPALARSGRMHQVARVFGSQEGDLLSIAQSLARRRRFSEAALIMVGLIKESAASAPQELAKLLKEAHDLIYHCAGETRPYEAHLLSEALKLAGTASGPELEAIVERLAVGLEQ